MKTRSSFKMEKIMRMVNEDRLSSLPDELIHIIFSFLDMKVVLSTSLLSRRWRDLWKCVPVINIDKIKWYHGVNFKRVKYNNFVDRLLLKNMSDIKRLCLNCGGYTDSRMVETWIYFAVRRHVQELCLDDFVPNWKFLNYIGGNIKTLQLVGVIVMGYSETGQLDIDFEAVEDLKMKNCDYAYSNHVNIYAPRLSKLVLSSDEAFSLSKIRVTAPNLKQLDCKIKTEKDYSYIDLSSLVTSHIDTIIASWDNRARESEVLTNCFKKVFRKVANARSLTVSACGFQIRSEGPNILKPTSISFHDIRYLKLKDWCGGNHSKAIPRMIEAFPDIETLVSERHKLDTNGRKGWESDLSAKFMQCDFKSVEFQSDGDWWNNELEFLEFLLGEATMLKDVTLTILQKEKPYYRGRKLVMLPTTSSSERILVKPTKITARR
ncbi:hypothetical protein ACHQM5_004953 [Ranunculus cassubicifolius]